MPATAAGILSRWEISPVFDAVNIDTARYPPRDRLTSWEAVQSEPSGVLNLARFRRKQSRLGVVYVRVSLHADQAEIRRLSFGYSDRLTVFLNGKPLYSGDSTWRSRDPTFLGIVGLDHDYVYLDLNKGDNELLLAVTELFGSWGLIARLDPPAATGAANPR